MITRGEASILFCGNPPDHTADHLPFRSIRKQWTGERRRARFSERKGAEKAIFGGKCHHKCVWEQDAAGSNPVTPYQKFDRRQRCSPLSVVFFAFFCVVLGGLFRFFEIIFPQTHNQIRTGKPLFLFTAAQKPKAKGAAAAVFPVAGRSRVHGRQCVISFCSWSN